MEPINRLTILQRLHEEHLEALLRTQINLKTVQKMPGSQELPDPRAQSMEAMGMPVPPPVTARQRVEQLTEDVQVQLLRVQSVEELIAEEESKASSDGSTDLA